MGEVSPPRYHEPARTFASSIGLLVLMLCGFVLDLILGGGIAHVIGWLIGTVLVVGIDVLVVGAARTHRSVTLTDDELRVGEQAVSRAEIVAVSLGDDRDLPVLGISSGSLPRGSSAVTLRLADGRAIAVPTRHPERLAGALALGDAVPVARTADADDLPLLAEIDHRAESLFRVAGMELPDIPFSLDALHSAGAIFVVGRPPVGFVVVGEVDGVAHVQELAVLPGHMRKGIGSVLLDSAISWARRKGYRAITLTTYADVPWNAPFYAARGFTALDALTPGLAEIRDWEHAVGLDAVGRRIAMRRDLT